MDAADFVNFSSALTTLGHGMRTEVSELNIEAYWHALKDLPTRHVLRALERGLKGFDGFPRPVDIRRAARDSMRDEANEEAGRRIPRLPAHQFTFLLGLLRDPNVPETQKQQAKEQWKKRFSGKVPPWEEAR